MFEGLVPNGSDSIVINGDKVSGDHGMWNGFQLVETGAIPEPSSTALLGLGGLALILRRRRD
jgi:hypothetical protein